ncbi:hypothetical protein VZT92_007072 [Zoarces viviparus]|uniref:Uncharacterized protein n=1 Tax=Zoarces viviparus TaxID=48416 RepID=A0AAW1FLW9_ZOAVI
MIRDFPCSQRAQPSSATRSFPSPSVSFRSSKPPHFSLHRSQKVIREPLKKKRKSLEVFKESAAVFFPCPHPCDPPVHPRRGVGYAAWSGDARVEDGACGSRSAGAPWMI